MGRVSRALRRLYTLTAYSDGRTTPTSLTAADIKIAMSAARLTAHACAGCSAQSTR